MKVMLLDMAVSFPVLEPESLILVNCVIARENRLSQFIVKEKKFARRRRAEILKKISKIIITHPLIIKYTATRKFKKSIINYNIIVIY